MLMLFLRPLVSLAECVRDVPCPDLSGCFLLRLIDGSGLVIGGTRKPRKWPRGTWVFLEKVDRTLGKGDGLRGLLDIWRL